MPWGGSNEGNEGVILMCCWLQLRSNGRLCIMVGCGDHLWKKLVSLNLKLDQNSESGKKHLLDY